MDTSGSKFQCSFLRFWHSVTINSKSNLLRSGLYLVSLRVSLSITKFHFHQPRLVLTLLLPKDMAENFPRFPIFLCFSSIRLCSFNVTVAIMRVFRSPGSIGPRSDLMLVPRSRVGKGRSPVSVKLFIQLFRLKSLSTVP